MAGFPIFIIFTSVIFQLTVTTASGTLKEVVGALGGSVTFPLNITKKEIDTVLWTFKKFTLAIVNEEKVTVLQNRKRERIVFQDGSPSMTLSQLEKNDSGVYRAEIHSTSLQSPFTQEYALQVYEYLSMPKVTMHQPENQNGTCIMNLTCYMEQGGENANYSWKAVGQGANEFHDGASLPISWRLGEKDKTLICMASNPISSNSSAPILAQNLCEDSAKDKNSSMFLPHIYIGYILPVLIMVLLMITLLAIWIEKRKGSEKDMERVDSHQKVSNFCLHLEENTEYDTIPYTNKTNLEEDAPNTLYSTVHFPKAVKSPSSLTAMPHTPRPLSYENVI